MELSNELLHKEIGRLLLEQYNAIEIDYNSIVQTKALEALTKIKKIIHDEKLDDFMKVDEIVDVFIEYNIDIGGCHDF